VFCDKSLELRFKGRKHALQLRFVYLEIPRGLLLNLVNLQEHNQTILMLVQQNRNATICSFRSNLNILTSQAKLAEKIDEAASMCDTDYCQQFFLQELQCSAMSINVVRTCMLLTDTAAPPEQRWRERRERRTARLVAAPLYGLYRVSFSEAFQHPPPAMMTRFGVSQAT
jgi:hypothetical protein